MTEYNVVDKPKGNRDILNEVAKLEDGKALSISFVGENTRKQLVNKRMGLLIMAKNMKIKIKTTSEKIGSTEFLYVFKA